MKKTWISALATAVLCSVSCLSLSAQAATLTNDGITAEIVTDNNYYSADDTAKVTLKVTNYNDFSVQNISISSILPENLLLVDTEETGGTVDHLNAGETMKLSLNVKQLSTLEETAQDADNQESSSTTAQNKQSAPQTGDDIAIAMMVGLFALALALVLFGSKKKTARMLSVMLVFFFCGNVICDLKAAADDSKKSFALSETLNFNGTEYDLTLETSYTAFYYDADTVYTRGQWMLDAAQLFHIDERLIDVDEEHYDFFYGDTKGTENGMIFEYLNKDGDVPAPDNEGYEDPDQDIPLFEADKPVTREYAAYSIVKLLGFEDSPTAPVCNDADALAYPAQVATAMAFNMFALIDGSFEPDRLLTHAEYSQVRAVAKTILNSTYIPDDEKTEKVTYQENVIVDEIAEITDYTATKNADGSYTVVLPVTEATAQFAADTLFVLQPKTEDGETLALKVTSAENNGNTVTLACTVPEDPAEILQNVCIRDTFQPSAADFIPAEGVTVQLADSAESSGDAAPLDVELADIDKSITNSVPLVVTAEVGDFEFEASLLIPYITVVYKSHEEVGWDFWNSEYVVDEAAFLINAQADLSASVILISAGDFAGDDDELTFLENAFLMGNDSIARIQPAKPEITLGKLPIVLPAGFTACVDVCLKVDFTGKFTIGFHIDSTFGYQYTNGQKRNPKDLSVTLSKLELLAEIKVGPKIEASAGWGPFTHLLGVDVFFGPNITGAVTWHTDAKLVCMGVDVFFFLELGLSDDCKLGKLLDKFGFSLRLDVFNADNSPLKWTGVHYENLKRVSECTYGEGALNIHVKDSDGNNIKQCKISVYDAQGRFIKTDFTDSSGIMELSGLKPGTVKLEIRATGYKKFTDHQIIHLARTTYAEIVLMVSRSDENIETDAGVGKNYAQGKVLDAVTGGQTDASFVVREGSNASPDKEIVAEGSSADGAYKVALPVGYYTITFSKEGYLDSSINVHIKASAPTTKNVVISTELSSVDTNADLRVVLTWGEYPYDLDSHLLSSQGYHIYFGSMSSYENSEMLANLDVDDTSSYGPETTTLYTSRTDEKFSYYVHDYSNKSSSGSTQMSLSDARVVVYSGSNVAAVFNTPIGVAGNLWHVFDYDPATGEITPVNTYHTISSNIYGTYYYGNY